MNKKDYIDAINEIEVGDDMKRKIKSNSKKEDFAVATIRGEE